MALYKVYYRWRNTETARTLNLNSPSESEAVEKLVRQGTVPAEKVPKKRLCLKPRTLKIWRYACAGDENNASSKLTSEIIKNRFICFNIKKDI